MARDQNTYAKRARETERRRKAEDKRVRRRKKKEQAIESALATKIDAAAVALDNIQGEDI